MLLSEALRDRNNHFNLIRMIAAVTVAVSHAFFLTMGTGTAEPLTEAFGFSLGHVAVLVFFAISGLLIPRSLDLSGSLSTWARSRVLRIFPGLLAVTLVTVLLFGPLATSQPVAVYLSSPAILNYVLGNLTLLAVSIPLPGLFTANPHPELVNGSLWTIGHEVACYILVAFLGIAGALSATGRGLGAAALLLAAYAAARYLHAHGLLSQTLWHLAIFALPFLLGTAAYVLRHRIVLEARTCLGLAVLSWALHDTVLFREAFSLTVVYLSLYLGLRHKGALLRYNSLGDYSYGFYIYAWPVQQLVAHFGAPQSVVASLAMVVPATLLCAVLSWHLVERPMLRLKTRRGQEQGQPATRAESA